MIRLLCFLNIENSLVCFRSFGLFRGSERNVTLFDGFGGLGEFVVSSGGPTLKATVCFDAEAAGFSAGLCSS